MMTDEQVQSAVHTAVGGVIGETPPLNFRAAHERSTAHRLAVHMEPHFPEWNVDCEYDRDGQVRKALEGIAHCDAQKKTDDILPDIIVHHREREGRDHNLLVIELKKDAEADVCDQKKLELLTHPGRRYQYQLGLYINVDDGRFTCTWFKDGRRIGVTHPKSG